MRAGSYESIHSLNEVVSRLIDEADIDLALRIISNFVERIITEPLCTTQVFGSKTLDRLCQRIGEVNLRIIKQEIVKIHHNNNALPVIVYIVSKLQNSGGHTRVIEDFIKTLPDAQHVILSTELSGNSNTDYLMKGSGPENSIVIEQAPKLDYQQRLTWLQKRILNLTPHKIYLFNHHQDSVAVAATQPEMKLNASFYHHGDHHLCLGVHLSHLKHIDPHPMGYHNCRNALGIKNIYIPLTVKDKGDRPANWPFMDNGKLTTCTAARSNKIEIPYFISYLDLVPRLLNVTKGRHIHIGRLTPWALFKINRGLKRHSIPSDRFIYTPWVPSVWRALHDYRVDLYVASFPYGGGLTLIEAMGAGIPVILHRHIFSRILSGIDLAYPGAFSWRFPDELLNYCSSATPDDLVKAGRLSRMQYAKYHSSKLLKEILNGVAPNYPRPGDLSEIYSVQSDEWALWMERQLTIKRVISRTSYRLLRRFRACFL